MMCGSQCCRGHLPADGTQFARARRAVRAERRFNLWCSRIAVALIAGLWLIAAVS
jgi:hypothetical protein